MKLSIIVLMLLLAPIVVLANSPPVLETIRPQAIEVGREFVFLVGSTDSDGDALNFTDDSDIFDVSSSGSIKFKPQEKDAGIHTFTIKASDGEFESSTSAKLIINKNLTDIKTDPQIIRVNLKRLANISKQVFLTNNGQEKAYLAAETKTKWISIASPNIEVEGGSQKPLDVSINPEQGTVQTGSITIYGGIKEKTVPIIVTTSTQDSGLGVSLDISAKFRSIEPGTEIAPDITIINLNKARKPTLDVEYLVKDLQDNVIMRSVEQVSIDKEFKKTKKLSLPSFLGEGDYILAAIVSQNGATESAAEIFSISKGHQKESIIQYAPSNIQIIISVVIIVLVSILLYLNYGRLSNFEKKKTVQVEEIYREFLKDKESIENAHETKRKLEKQLESLEKAYKMKIISEDSYKRGKKRIEEFVKKIKI